MMMLLKQINLMRAALNCAKPRSRRRIELEIRLRQLLLQQLRRENRAERRR
jgi:hypothetical protein